MRAALASMPDVGADEDFEFERDLPRPRYHRAMRRVTGRRLHEVDVG